MIRAYKTMAIVGGAGTSIGTYHVEEYGELGARAEASRAAALWQRVYGRRRCEARGCHRDPELMAFFRDVLDWADSAWQGIRMNNALTADDLSDLKYVSDRTGSDWQKLPCARELDDNGERLLGLGLLEVRVAAKYSLPGSARLGVSDAGLDELFERGL